MLVIVTSGEVGSIVDAPGAGSRLAWLDYDHPVFELFSAPRIGDFSDARFLRFWSMEPDAGATPLARFESGEPALVEHAQFKVASRDYEEAASLLRQALRIKREPRVERFLARVEQATRR